MNLFQSAVIACLPLITPGSASCQGVHSNCSFVLEQLVEYDHLNPLRIEVVTDSVRLEWPVQSAVHYYRSDSLGNRTGPAATYYFDGYILRGQYENGERAGVWILYDCNKDMSIVDEYHYLHGIVEGVVTQRKIKKKKLSSIPLIY